jgi:uncharacterized protein
MTTMEKRCIVLFVKCPERGKVKTRLSPVLEEGLVVSLYGAFVADLLETIRGTALPFRIAFTPGDREATIVRRFGGGDRFPQAGADLGERMKNAFERCFADGFGAVVLIGSDIPDLPAEAFREAFAALERRGAVIGPTVDGGYGLIGFRKDAFVPGVFEGVPWSTGRVLAVTLEKLAQAGTAVHRLPPWRDVDTPEDLLDLWNRHRDTPFACSRTIAFLRAARPALLFGGAPP